MVKWIQKIVKRSFDFFAASCGLIALSPVFCIAALLIKIDSEGPVFFKHRRVGKDGEGFISYKFRTMVEDAIHKGLKIEVAKDDTRITAVGAFLRQWSLDEIPQLINILKGEMSLVGPRPALLHQVAKYSEFEKKRLTVKPGITGWAQINGRNLLSWKERIKLDVWYIENWSLWLDLKILLTTPRIVLSKEGLYGKDGVARDYG
jgi:exopolysaccharide biosynthesis polyprenyl glycosylphosphotransferase